MAVMMAVWIDSVVLSTGGMALLMWRDDLTVLLLALRLAPHLDMLMVL